MDSAVVVEIAVRICFLFSGAHGVIQTVPTAGIAS